MDLLRGVEAARTKYDCLKSTMEIRYVLPLPAKTIECLIEMKGDKLRFEVIPGEVAGETIIRNGDVFYDFRRVAHNDIEIFDVKMATGSRGTLAFDPRIIGLSDVMSCDLTVRDCLFYGTSKKLEVVGKVALHGVSTWQVRAERDDCIAEFWIEEPSFRVHRKTIDLKGLRIDIESQFDSSEESSPFPSQVHVIRKAEHGFETFFKIKNFDVDAEVPSDRFALNSINPPRNTMINDYRISQIVGYWDGKGISKDPVRVTVPPASVKKDAPIDSDR